MASGRENFKTQKELSAFKSKLSATLGQNVKKNKIAFYPDALGHYYGLPEWLGQYDTPKHEFMHDKLR